MDSQQFFDHLWQDFVGLAPQAADICRKLTQQGEQVVNDHVAFRTFNRAPLNIASLETMIFSLGYQRLESYHFKNKHLNAWSYMKPSAGGREEPLIFFSELDVMALSAQSQEIIDRLIEEVIGQFEGVERLRASFQDRPLFAEGRLWSMISYAEYEHLLKESEYAAWLALHGFHANHFTVSLNHLTHYKSVESMLTWVESEGFTVNASGGRVKGGADLLLEQGSTMADQVEVTFGCGHRCKVPGCFYEFALRYPTPEGALFMGFVEGNADKIFESTRHQPNP